ncbi:hypothetical protein L2E82_29995 [Cichorium intybus]|uniref:Uncharacterized protein n=1 Tax=Cichorium intybus TaxID=13427 RepID=A0ACB9CZI2_CICIN|nr:hypothetical protein L2E82_29995 [Cichorium intybus]
MFVYVQKLNSHYSKSWLEEKYKTESDIYEQFLELKNIGVKICLERVLIYSVIFRDLKFEIEVFLLLRGKFAWLKRHYNLDTKGSSTGVKVPRLSFQAKERHPQHGKSVIFHSERMGIGGCSASQCPLDFLLCV